MAGEQLASAYATKTTLVDTDIIVIEDAAFAGWKLPGSAIVKKDASGNVAIGTSFARSRLEVGISPTTSTYDTLIISGGLSAGGQGHAASWYQSGSFRTGYIACNADSSGVGTQLHFGTTNLFGLLNAVDRMVITRDGHILPGADNSQNIGSAVLRFGTVYAGTGAINTSDEREKTDIGEIPDEWLDAWAGIEWRRFKMVGGKRWHVGLVAQQVHAAFAAHDLDAFEIGLCCFDAWEEQREPIYETVTHTRKATRTEQVPAGKNDEGEPLFTLREVKFDEEYDETVDTGETRVTLEAGDRWGLRYDECQVIEAAWQRREMARMAARLAALESQ